MTTQPRTVADRMEDPRLVVIAVTLVLSALLWWVMAATMDTSLPSFAPLQPEAASSSMSGGEATTSGTERGSMAGDQGMQADSARGSAAGETAARGSGAPGSGTMGGMSALPSLTGMWTLMMVAMMLPAMVPVLAIYTRLSAKEHAGLRLAGRITLFAVGYLALWVLFSAFAAAAQLGLAATPYFSAAGTQAGPLAAGVVMIAAGLFQLTPMKDACLDHCRHPVTFLIAHWRDGVGGAFPMGVHHGAYCVGCCGVFMGLMFVFGAMNVLWMALLTLYFIAEKTLPRADVWGRAVGGVLIFAGVVQTARALIV